MLHIHLFGKFRACQDDLVLDSLGVRKAQELLSYLLLYRQRPHLRETLANLLWCDFPAAQSRKHLRQTLWQLQSALDGMTGVPLLFTDDEWIGVNDAATVWLDTAVFEQVSGLVRGVTGSTLDGDRVLALKAVVALCQTDLLEGWYQDWCVYERQRLHHLLIIMLHKLLEYCEAHHEYEAGLAYGNRILRSDRAHERTHRQLMRLYYLAGDRTAALRQYQVCVDTLRAELAVAPTHQTQLLYDQICGDRLDAPALPIALPTPLSSLADVFQVLNRLQSLLSELQFQLEQPTQA